MIVARTISELREAMLPARVAAKRIGFVPTMGALHAGHLHLMHTAREDCDFTVVSLFVNPTQFGDPADLAAYPRDEVRDTSVADNAGVDVLFAPSAPEMYPAGFNTHVVVAGVTAPLEGVARGVEHFVGVATVVSKLFNIVQPHAAYFGQKDAQQVAVIKQMVRDFNFPIDIVVCSTVREHDGLALSSRNVRLSAAAREQALGLSAALRRVEQLIAGGEHRTATLLENAQHEMTSRGIKVSDIEYFTAVDNKTLEPVSVVDTSPVLFVMAVRVDGVRLIDNVLVNRSGHTVSP